MFFVFGQSVASEWDVQAMPTFMYIKEGKLLEKFAGANKAKLEELVNKHSQPIAVA